MLIDCASVRLKKQRMTGTEPTLAKEAPAIQEANESSKNCVPALPQNGQQFDEEATQ